MIIDLQMHSTYSDGQLTPTSLALFMKDKRVKVAALTDHNTVAGLEEFRVACDKLKIKSIPGIELYVKYNHKHFNILWFNFDENNPALHRLLRETQIRRKTNVRRVLHKLVDYGLEIDIDAVLDKYNHYTPINGLISCILNSRKNRDLISKELELRHPREEDIIHYFFKNKDIAFLRESYIDLSRIFKLRKEIGGQIMINHPGKNGHLTMHHFQVFKDMGMDGLEVLSPHHAIGAVMYYQYVAREFDFISTGGSDFHRFEGGVGKVQSSWDYFRISTNHLRKIKKIIGK